jgi:hypothetical protein
MLSLLLATTCFQTSPQAELLLEIGDTLPSGQTVTAIGVPSAGRDGGWVAAVSYSSTFSTLGLLVGQPPGGLAGPLHTFRTQPAPSTHNPTHMSRPSMACGRFAYLGGAIPDGDGATVFVDDTLIFYTVHSSIPGLPGYYWDRFQSIDVLCDGSFLVSGEVYGPGTPREYLLWSSALNGPLLRTGDLLPGMLHPVGSFQGVPRVSPSGQHWSLIVQDDCFLCSRSYTIVDGVVAELAEGVLARSFEPLPLTFNLALGFPASITTFPRAPAINDRGDVALTFPITTAGYVTSRNGRLVEPDSALGIDVDATGALLNWDRTGNSRLRFEGRNLYHVLNDVPLDIDRDGSPDPGFHLSNIYDDDVVVAAADQAIYLRAHYTSPSGSQVFGIFRFSEARVDHVVCLGTLNSSGSPAGLVAAGSAELANDDVTLHAFGLPRGSSGYVVISRSEGPPTPVPGSVGELCLRGAFGRQYSTMFYVGFDGRAASTLPLGALAQPNGPVAAMAGDTWYAQAWYRDAVSGSGTSNFTDAIRIDFR